MNSVDYAEQWNAIYQKLEAEWNVTSDSWSDCVHDSFQNRYVQKMKDSIVAYLQGQCGGIHVHGVGLVELLNRIEEIGEKMESLTGVPFSIKSAEERQGNDYIELDELLLDEYDCVKEKYRNKREEEILIHETDDIIWKREHPNSLKTILDI